MEIRRFYINQDDVKEKIAEVSGEEFNHAVKVLRQKVGFRIILNTGDGFDYFAEITDIAKTYFTAKLLGKEKNEATPSKKITLYQGSMKLGKNDFAVQKAVELGATKIVFFDSKNVAEKKVNVERLQKIAVEAMKQCGRADRFFVEFLPFAEAVKTFDGVRTVLFYENESERFIKNVDFSGISEINVVVGSEGGFEPEEVKLAESFGAVSLSLGKRILRAETATIVSLTLVSDKIGGLE